MQNSIIWANVSISGIRVKKFHTDKGIFVEEGFKSYVSDNNQTMSYCGVGAHFHNRIANDAIKQLTEKTRTMLIHLKHQWPEVYTLLLALRDEAGGIEPE